MIIGKKAVLFISTGFFIGYIPVAPGTFGSLVGLPLAFILARINLPIAIIGVVLFIFVAMWFAGKAEQILKQSDPGCIVIDEVAGLLLTIFLLPTSWITLCLGFILFRLFDILKPFPIRRLEKGVRGGTGIVLDDILAGIYANLCLRLVIYLL